MGKPSSSAVDALPVTRHPYTDEEGNNLYRVCRIGTGKDKVVWQEPWGIRPAATGQFGSWEQHEDWLRGESMNGVRLVLYRLPDVRAAASVGMHLYVTEGEKCAERVEQEGEVATTNPGGAGKWQDSYADSMKGVGAITICVDKDEEGWNHARQVLASLRRVLPATVTIATVEAKEGHDVKDHLDAGLSLDELVPVDLGDDAPPRSGNYVPRAERLARAEWVREGTFRQEQPRLLGRRPWPEIDPKAYHGLAGDVVWTIEPHTEADPTALLVEFLVSFGSALGAGPHVKVGAKEHPPRLWAVLVAPTGRGRKGTAHAEIRRVFLGADPDWTTECEINGLSTGEGLIADVSDSQESTDKRRLVVGAEFYRVLAVAGRENNTLSPILRQAWDGDRLQTLTKKSPDVATGAHISIIAHITGEELRKRLTDTEIMNGFANRFLYCAARASKELPEGGALPGNDLARLEQKVRAALLRGRKISELHRTAEGKARWAEVYHEIKTTKMAGLMASVTARADAYNVRLQAAYALLDGSDVIDVEHVEAAWAMWRYCEDSAAHVFGSSTGSPLSDKILDALLEEGGGRLNRKAINHGVLSGNYKSWEIDEAIALLIDQRVAHMEKGDSTDRGGRPPEYVVLDIPQDTN